MILGDIEYLKSQFLFKIQKYQLIIIFKIILSVRKYQMCLLFL